jgi:hypothetical protein
MLLHEILVGAILSAMLSFVFSTKAPQQFQNINTSCDNVRELCGEFFALKDKGIWTLYCYKEEEDCKQGLPCTLMNFSCFYVAVI